MDYNVPGGKLNRGLTVVHTLEALQPHATPEALEQACILGWCIEWLQASFLVADDIMDASVTRRGAPCWYKVPAIGMIAINDTFLLQSHLFATLRRHFQGSHHYLPLVELFNHIKWQTELGQMLDLTTSPLPGQGQVDLGRFTQERYELIVKHKTAYYTFVLPIMCALILAEGGGAATGAATATLTSSSSPHRPLATRILLLMGEYFQVQDDYLDAYAPPEVLGKVGTDIQDAKCSWLVVQALAKVGVEGPGREVLTRHYGKHGEEDVAAVKALYHTLGLEEAFRAYEARSYDTLKAWIEEASAAEGLPKEVFTLLLDKIYKRKM